MSHIHVLILKLKYLTKKLFFSHLWLICNKVEKLIYKFWKKGQLMHACGDSILFYIWHILLKANDISVGGCATAAANEGFRRSCTDI